MQNKIDLPYGKKHLQISFSDDQVFDQILPVESLVSRKQEINIIEDSLTNCIDIEDGKLLSNTDLRIAIAVNDATRPIPNDILLPPLLNKIEDFGIPPDNISLFIATGTHKCPTKHEIFDLLSQEVAEQYRVIVHDCDDLSNLIFLGNSADETPIYVNKEFYFHDIKVVVGQIEPHHFMGFSGGVKSAVIGLGGRKTIEMNHQKIIDPMAKMGIFYKNPMRQEVEEIGEIIGVDIALNVILNSKKQIVKCLYGDPCQVILKGIKASAKICQVKNHGEYDLVIASPGGYPKDINFYQSQKAITHACTFLKKNGVVILTSECAEGPGSKSFERFFDGKQTPLEIITSFENQEFKIGPHKAYQLALQLMDYHIIVVSDMGHNIVRKMLLTPASDISEAISKSKIFLPEKPRIAVLPYATHTMI